MSSNSATEVEGSFRYEPTGAIRITAPQPLLSLRAGSPSGSTEVGDALYKTLHDARRKLRKHLDEHGLALDDRLEEE